MDCKLQFYFLHDAILTCFAGKKSQIGTNQIGFKRELSIKIEDIKGMVQVIFYGDKMHSICPQTQTFIISNVDACVNNLLFYYNILGI